MSSIKSPPLAPLMFDGRQYKFDSLTCYDKGWPVRLPDGRVLGVVSWVDSYPPKPAWVGNYVTGPTGDTDVTDYDGPVVHARTALPTVALCGFGRAGKDTAGKMLRKLTTLTYSGSLSWVGLPYMAHRLGVCEQEAWEERHQNRMLWKQYLDEYRAGDPSRLIRESLQRGQLVVGVRDGVELLSARKEGLLDHIIWVHREGTPVDPTVTYTADDCDFTLDNSGTEEELYSRLDKLVDSLGLPRRDAVTAG